MREVFLDCWGREWGSIAQNSETRGASDYPACGEPSLARCGKGQRSLQGWDGKSIYLFFSPVAFPPSPPSSRRTEDTGDRPKPAPETAEPREQPPQRSASLGGNSVSNSNRHVRPSRPRRSGGYLRVGGDDASDLESYFHAKISMSL